MMRSRSAWVAAFVLALPQWGALAQPRATLWIRWTSDSSWEGSYLDKPYTFHVREVLDGRLVFALGDSALLPRAGVDERSAPGRAIDVIQINESGTTSGAALVDARGSTAYTVDMTKEGGDCTISDQPDTSGVIRTPYIGHEAGQENWSARAPGVALILIRAGSPVAFAFAPTAIRVESAYRILCPKPESARRVGNYRVSVRFGDLVNRRGAAANPADAQWALETTRTARGGYTVRGAYDVVVRQHRAMPSDPASAFGKLVVSKRVTLAWEPGDATSSSAPTPN